MMKSPKFKIYGIKRTPKRIKVVRKEIQGNKRQSWPKSSIKFNSLMYLKQELAEDLNKSFSTLPTQARDNSAWSQASAIRKFLFGFK